MNPCSGLRRHRPAADERQSLNQHREKNMQIRTMLAVACAALPLLAAAQESTSSKTSGDANELGNVIASYAKRSGKKFVLDARTRASVDLAGLDANKLTYDELLTVINVNMFVAYTDGDVTVVVPDSAARQVPSPVFTDPKFTAHDGELVTLLMTPKNACAPQLVPVLRPMMPQAAHLAAEMVSNTLIINDRAINVRRIAELVRDLDRAAPEGKRCDMTMKKD
jgi:general secretion pathway protein D